MKSTLYIPPPELRDPGIVLVDRAVPGLAGIFVNQWGHIRSLNSRWTKDVLRVRSIHRNADMPGWYYGHVVGKALKQIAVRKMVALAFIGPQPRKCYLVPLNNDYDDHRLSNLRYCTYPQLRDLGLRMSPLEFWRRGQLATLEKRYRALNKPKVRGKVGRPRKERPPPDPGLSPADIETIIAEVDCGRLIEAIWRERYCTRIKDLAQFTRLIEGRRG